MSVPEESAASKAADEQTFAAAQAADQAAVDLHQQQAETFQNARTPPADVRAGEEALR
jgi:hypothetical protein